MKKLAVLFSIAFLLMVLAGCGNTFLESASMSGEGLSVPRYVSSSEYYNPPYQDFLKMEDGVLGPGAEYRIALPPAWQSFPEGMKNLIIYSHGYVTPGLEFSQTEEYVLINEVIASFIEEGFAVAYSSYAESGWAVKDGTIRTRQLRDYVINSIGQPDNIYLCGVSEGALIAIKLAEQNPELFDGVLAFAGPLGGAELEFGYILNTRLAFNHFFKPYLEAAAFAGNPQAVSLYRALGNGVFDVHPDPARPEYASSTPFIADMVPLLAGLMSMEPARAFSLANVTVDGRNLFPADTWLSSPLFLPEFAYTLATALWYNIYGTNDLLEKTRNKMPLDNTESIYLSPAGEFDVQRFESHPAAVKYLEHWYKPHGELQIPVVSLHMTRDPAVPFFHEEAYAVMANLYGNLLTQITIEGFGHGTLLDLSGPAPVLLADETLDWIKGAFEVLLAEVAAHQAP